MSRQESKKLWAPVGFGLVLMLILIDTGLSLLRGGRNAQRPAVSKFAPEFRVGEVAPDFTLSDRAGAQHRLSDLVRRDTLLCFICGCSNCLDLQTYLAILIRKMGSGAPDVISVTTMPKDREETYYRDTRLKQQLLYEPKDGPVMQQYRGHPCPRVYRLRGDRTVAWIGSSPGDRPYLTLIGNELAEHLGFPPEGGPEPSVIPSTAVPAKP